MTVFLSLKINKYSYLPLVGALIFAPVVFAQTFNGVGTINTSATPSEFVPVSEDLKTQKAPQDTETLDKKAISTLSGHLNKLANDTNFKQQMTAAQKIADRREYSLYSSHLAPFEEASPNPLEVYDVVSKRSSDVISKDVASKVPVFNALSGGYDFKLDFSRFFGSGSSSARQSNSSRHKAPRYGLILKSIETRSPRKSTAQAALRSKRASELDRSNSELATMQWTIGPQYEPTGDTKVFNSSVVEEASSTNAWDTSGINARAEDGELFWLNGAIPRPAVKTNIKPADEKVLRESFGGTVTTPRLKISVAQDQDLYQWSMSVNDGGKKKNITEHQVKLPVIGTLAVSRVYDEKFKPTLTSLSGVLVYSSLPMVTLSHKEQTQQFITETKYGTEQTLGAISFVTRSDAKVDEKSRTKSENMRTYELGFKKLL